MPDKPSNELIPHKGNPDELLLERIQMSSEMRDAPENTELGSARVILERLSDLSDNPQVIEAIKGIAYMRVVLKDILGAKEKGQTADIISGIWMPSGNEIFGDLTQFKEFAAKYGSVLNKLLAKPEYDSIFKGTVYENERKKSRLGEPHLNRGERVLHANSLVNAEADHDAPAPADDISTRVTAVKKAAPAPVRAAASVPPIFAPHFDEAKKAAGVLTAVPAPAPVPTAPAAPTTAPANVAQEGGAKDEVTVDEAAIEQEEPVAPPVPAPAPAVPTAVAPEADPEHETMMKHLRAAILAREAGDLEKADNEIAEIVDMKKPQIDVEQCIIFMAKKDDESLEIAQNCFEDALSKDPNNVEANCRMGILLKKKNPAKALEHFQKAIAADPKHILALLGCGRLLKAAGGGKRDAKETYEAKKMFDRVAGMEIPKLQDEYMLKRAKLGLPQVPSDKVIKLWEKQIATATELAKELKRILDPWA